MNSMFNLDDYKTAATKIKEVHDNYPMCRFNIRSIEVNHAQGYVWVVTEIYRDVADPFSAAVDVAYEYRSEKGVNRDFWVENCVTSSYGRCCSLLLGDDQRSSREDMDKVNRLNAKPVVKPFAEKLADKITMPVENDPWTTKSVEAAPSSADAIALVQDVLGAVKIDKDIPLCRNCHDHKPMEWKTGVSAKNNQPWGKFSCYVCRDVMWYRIAADGTWKPQEVRA
jgi:hypothetical protein